MPRTGYQTEMLRKEKEVMPYEARRAITSGGVNPASANLASIDVTVSKGSGTSRSGEGAVAAGRPNKKSSCGAPGQLDTPTAPANWMLGEL